MTLPPGNLISHIFRENEVCRDTEWERYFCYKNIEVPEIYSGPHLTFPLTVEQAVGLVEAFRNKKVRRHHCYTVQSQLRFNGPVSLLKEEFSRKLRRK